jgi:hypothetical protein
MTSIPLETEDNLIFLENRILPHFFQMEEDLNIVFNGRRPQY